MFDTETTIDPSQRVQVGVWRLYRDDPDREPGVTCIEEGMFYPDDLEGWDPEGYRTLMTYAEGRPSDADPGFPSAEFGRSLVVKPLSWWLEERFHNFAYEHRDRCDVVGFNLLFDLTRIARHCGPGQRGNRGGWSLRYWETTKRSGRKWDTKYRPRLQAKSIDSKRTLFNWAGTGETNTKGTGRFVDLRTLSFALTNGSHSLASACEAFGVPIDKTDPGYGTISFDLLDYARRDVAATAGLYRACLTELAEHHGVDLEPSRLFSPATVGASYLEAMGLRKPMTQFASVPDEIHGYAMSAFYGGRVEARIVRTPIPVAYVDATSMYPTVNALLGTWSLLTAQIIDQVDTTQDVRDLLADPRLEDRCFERGFWRDQIGVTFVELDHPDGALLPVRGQYDETSPDPRIGVNPLRYQGTIWYALPDVIASVLLTGNAAPVARAIRLTGTGQQPTLRPVPLRGGPEINPASEDPFVRFIELRHRIRQDDTLAEAERDRLDQFLKITANATSYGVLARYDRKTLSKPTTVIVYGPDPLFESQTKYPEDPGPYCFPPIAATITAAARLMLALLERQVTEAGGVYGFCDTDSMGIVSHPDLQYVEAPTPDGTNQIPILHPDTVTGILARFDPLNPYRADLIPRLWKPEHGSLDEPLWAYVISSKRYALYRYDADGAPQLIHTEGHDDADPDGLEAWTEHGLGLYLDPTGPKPDRDDQGRRVWMRQVWEWTLTRALTGTEPPLPDWAPTYALTRFSLTSQTTAAWFTGYNKTVTPDREMRAGNFGLLAHPAPFAPPPP
ncbi:MAG: hypothetical protein KKE89_06345, partial [Actinobacteria bacterium]|nr:hypothetical protein [Actinomycetota bacterium]